MSKEIYTTLADSKVMKVIHTRVAVGEVGVDDPPRVVHLYHALDGTLLAQFDPSLGPVGKDIQSGILRMCRLRSNADLDEMDRACSAKVGGADVNAA